MTTPGIGWYVHHHGFGHVARFLAVQPHLRVPVVVFSSLAPPPGLPDDVEWMRLPADNDPIPRADGSGRSPADADPRPRERLHWAPLGHPGHRDRLARIARAIADRPLSTVVVDVSVEVTTLVRLLGARTVIFTQPGDRTDPAHDLAFDLADTILAPWAEGTVPAAALSTRRDRTVWTGGISRFDGRAPASPVSPVGAPSSERRVVFLGRTLSPDSLADAVERLTAAGWESELVGADEASRVEDPWPALSRASVVVTAAGQNSIADLAAVGARSVVIAQPRPFDEQAVMAQALARLGLAQVANSDVDADALVSLVSEAAALEPDWSRWRVRGAAARAAHAITVAALAGTDAA